MQNQLTREVLVYLRKCKKKNITKTQGLGVNDEREGWRGRWGSHKLGIIDPAKSFFLFCDVF